MKIKMLLIGLLCVSSLLGFCATSYALMEYEEVYQSNVGFKKVVIVTRRYLYDAIQSSLAQYVKDLEREYYHVTLVAMRRGTPHELKDYLKTFRNLKGALFIGNIPSVLFKMESIGQEGDALLASEGLDKYPTDLFYADLDGAWQDTDGDGIYDLHAGSAGPEIWIGRLAAQTLRDPTMDEAALLRDYFQRNHAYRIMPRLFYVPRAFAFMDWDGLMHQVGVADDSAANTLFQVAATMMQQMLPMYPLMRTWFLGEAYPLTTDIEHSNTSLAKLKSKLQSGYEWVYVLAHGRPDKQSVFKDGVAEVFTAPSLRANGNNAKFFTLGSCLVGRFTADDYIGGAYIFGSHTKGLAALAFTRVSQIQMPALFYMRIGRLHKDSIGDAFRLWIATVENLIELIPEPIMKLLNTLLNLGVNAMDVDRGYMTLQGSILNSKRGLVILGDPTLTIW
ncbi:MAG: hypothetical protein KBA46_00840 [Candidatus Omnitrophica bacterium]|nr:hypothetical protein [Candidatus Omnitrophota bacterium]